MFVTTFESLDTMQIDKICVCVYMKLFNQKQQAGAVV